MHAGCQGTDARHRRGLTAGTRVWWIPGLSGGGSGCCVGGDTAGSGLDGNGSHGSATDGLRARSTRARQLVQRQGTARAWRGAEAQGKGWALEGM